MVAHTFNLTLRRQRQVALSEFKTSLFNIVSSRTTRHTQGNPASEKQTNKQTTTINNNNSKTNGTIEAELWEERIGDKELRGASRRKRGNESLGREGSKTA